MKYFIYIFIISTFFACRNEKTSDLQVQLINADLNKGIVFIKEFNEGKRKTLIYRVKKGGNSKEGQERVHRAKELEKDIESVLDYIEQLEKENSKNNFTLKKGKKLKRKLDEFINTLYKEYKDLGFSREHNDFSFLLELPKPDFDEEDTFEKVHFKYQNINKVKNILVEVKYKLLIYQNWILRKLAGDDYSHGMRFHHYKPFINSNKNKIKLGDNYEAQMICDKKNRISKLKNIYLNDKLIPFKELYDYTHKSEYIEVNIPSNKVNSFNLKLEFPHTVWNEEKEIYEDSTFYIIQKHKIIP